MGTKRMRIKTYEHIYSVWTPPWNTLVTQFYLMYRKQKLREMKMTCQKPWDRWAHRISKTKLTASLKPYLISKWTIIRSVNIKKQLLIGKILRILRNWGFSLPKSPNVGVRVWPGQEDLQLLLLVLDTEKTLASGLDRTEDTNGAGRTHMYFSWFQSNEKSIKRWSVRKPRELCWSMSLSQTSGQHFLNSLNSYKLLQDSKELSFMWAITYQHLPY